METADNYKLKVFRLVSGSSDRRQPILLQHGIFQSANDWVLNGKDSVPYQLLNTGDYDVWIGNNRGNIYSRFNTKYSAEENPK